MQTRSSRNLPASDAGHRSAINAHGLVKSDCGRIQRRLRISCPSRRSLAELARPQMQPVTAKTHPSDLAPLDAWWAIEDLWRRIRQHLAVEVRVDESGDSQLLFHKFRHWVGHDASELRQRLFDTELYAWQVSGSGECGYRPAARGSLVRLLDYEGDSMKLTLTPYRQIARAPQGDALNCLIKELMNEWRRCGNSNAH
ncbi:hypothetical protein [Roseateles albus]|uniref:Uncharacterized protein n=1 Tax=Roseateles albus TaxID=2987525 RepID=A0ABT5KK99_9BURK|nr:hypothetical protein [Roseateles albus]MDC8773340.1 hypothetical protein [Roseateles albus]